MGNKLTKFLYWFIVIGGASSIVVMMVINSQNIREQQAYEEQMNKQKKIVCQVAKDHMMIYKEGSPFLRDVNPIVESYCK